MGSLYIIATPIGNLEDITLRAIRKLFEVDILLCEDTRKTGLLLERLNTKKKPQLISYFEENEEKRIPEVVSLLKDHNVGLVSNAGTPTISDPGFKLVRECINQGINVISIPGVSAVTAALSISGLPTDKFLFLGFLPKKEGKRKKVLLNIQSNKQYSNIAINNITIVFFESPYRLLKTLSDINEIFGNISIVICRELTKVHEEIRRESVLESISHFQTTKPQGEFVLLFHLNRKRADLEEV